MSWDKSAALRPPFGAVLALLAAIAALAGCAECERDFDCPGTKVCDVEEGECEEFVCAEDRDCPPATRCRKNRCQPRTAEAPAEGADAVVLGASVSGAADAGPLSQHD